MVATEVSPLSKGGIDKQQVSAFVRPRVVRLVDVPVGVVHLGFGAVRPFPLAGRAVVRRSDSHEPIMVIDELGFEGVC